MTDIKKKFVKVYRKGLTEETLGGKPSELGFDHAIVILKPCCVLHELSVPEPEIKFQYTYTAFWHRYKCAPGPAPFLPLLSYCTCGFDRH